MKAQIQTLCDWSQSDVAELFQLDSYKGIKGEEVIYYQTFASERDAKQHLLSVACDNAMYDPQTYTDNGYEIVIRGVTAKIVTEGLV